MATYILYTQSGNGGEWIKHSEHNSGLAVHTLAGQLLDAGTVTSTKITRLE